AESVLVRPLPPPRRALPVAAHRREWVAPKSSWLARQRETDFGALKEDLRGRLVLATLGHELDGAVQIRFAAGEALRERERIAGRRGRPAPTPSRRRASGRAGEAPPRFPTGGAPDRRRTRHAAARCRRRPRSYASRGVERPRRRPAPVAPRAPSRPPARMPA